VFPRWFACPSLVTPDFKVEFEVNLVIVFEVILAGGGGREEPRPQPVAS